MFRAACLDGSPRAQPGPRSRCPPNSYRIAESSRSAISDSPRELNRANRAALSTGALAGITRECVIDIANKHFIPLLEGVYEMPDLTDADEIFLTSSSLGVAPVTTFDFRRYSVEAAILTRTIRQAFEKLTAVM